jgi:hypothetical protein
MPCSAAILLDHTSPVLPLGILAPGHMHDGSLLAVSVPAPKGHLGGRGHTPCDLTHRSGRSSGVCSSSQRVPRSPATELCAMGARWPPSHRQGLGVSGRCGAGGVVDGRACTPRGGAIASGRPRGAQARAGDLDVWGGPPRRVHGAHRLGKEPTMAYTVKRFGWIPDLPDHRDHLYSGCFLQYHANYRRDKRLVQWRLSEVKSHAGVVPDCQRWYRETQG